MRIEFRKIDIGKKDFEILYQNLNFSGNFSRNRKNLVEIVAKIEGVLPIICDRCSEIYQQDIDEEITLFVSNGEYNSKNSENLLEDVVEFYDEFVDFDALFESEIESIKSDYHICKNCK